MFYGSSTVVIPQYKNDIAITRERGKAKYEWRSVDNYDIPQFNVFYGPKTLIEQWANLISNWLFY